MPARNYDDGQDLRTVARKLRALSDDGLLRGWLDDHPHLAGIARQALAVADLLPHQRPPDGDWTYWLLLAGRGTGKTHAGASDLNDHMLGPPCDERVPGGHRAAIIAPTHDDAVDACVNGPSGIRILNPQTRMVGRKGGTFVVWPNGAEAKIFGTHTKEDTERLRSGGNRCRYWLDELAAWRYLAEAWDQMEFGRRLGPDPRVVITTTPKPRPLLRRLVADSRTVISRATTADNPHLSEDVRGKLFERYGGTYLGRQELHGELIDEAEGALWRWEWIEANRRPAPDLARVLVGVDPSGSDADGADEQGIVVAGKGVDGDLYVLADRSCKLSPDGWGRRAVQAWKDFNADAIVVERNYGGQMVVGVIKAAAKAMGFEGVRVIEVVATRGKVLRAEPVSALYEQGRAHHVEPMPQLESDMTAWEPESGWSPDRLDALVWAATKLILAGSEGPARLSVARTPLPGARPGARLGQPSGRFPRGPRPGR